MKYDMDTKNTTSIIPSVGSSLGKQEGLPFDDIVNKMISAIADLMQSMIRLATPNGIDTLSVWSGRLGVATVGI